MPTHFINPTKLPVDQSFSKADLDTPILAVDLDKMDANVAKISQGNSGLLKSNGDHTAKGISLLRLLHDLWMLER